MLSFKRQWNIIFRVAKREVNLLLRRPVYIFATIFVMFFCCVFFLTLFDRQAPEKMPIGVVDMDRSTISRRVMHELEATQGVTVKAVYSSYAEAREAMQQGHIYAFLVIPDRFYADLAAFKRPELTFYVNNAYTIGGNTGYKQLLLVMNLASGAFQREVLRKNGMPEYMIMKRIQPVAIDAHFVGNPAGNYIIYLMGIILPGVLGVIVLMTTIYTIGSELKWSTSRDWLRAAEGSFTRAIVGKLLPHTLLYCAMGIATNIVMFRMMHLPVHGSFLYLNVGMVVYIIAIESTAVFWIGLIPMLSGALSAGALYGMLSFSLSGFTFPKMAMLPWVQILTNFFPLRHYYMIYVNEVLMGGSVMLSLPHAMKLLLFVVLVFLVARRLHRAAVYLYFPKH